jgi:hypothetical protein
MHRNVAILLFDEVEVLDSADETMRDMEYGRFAQPA